MCVIADAGFAVSPLSAVYSASVDLAERALTITGEKIGKSEGRELIMFHTPNSHWQMGDCMTPECTKSCCILHPHNAQTPLKLSELLSVAQVVNYTGQIGAAQVKLKWASVAQAEVAQLRCNQLFCLAHVRLRLGARSGADGSVHAGRGAMCCTAWRVLSCNRLLSMDGTGRGAQFEVQWAAQLGTG